MIKHFAREHLLCQRVRWGGFFSGFIPQIWGHILTALPMSLINSVVTLYPIIFFLEATTSKNFMHTQDSPSLVVHIL